MDEIEPFSAEEFSRRLTLVAEAFSPATPVTTQELFSGRVQQLNRLIDVAGQRGQHSLVYGERGVGKTSLARVVHGLRERNGGLVAFYTCTRGDTFESIWRGILDEITFSVSRPGVGFAADAQESVVGAASLLPSDPAPADVRRVLSAMYPARVFITVDEFDRPADPGVAEAFADLIKGLSDSAAPVTLNLVGVASTVGELMSEHESITRSLVQIQMPVMNDEEAREIVVKGMDASELEVDEGFVDAVVDVSQGIPHYVHLIAQHGARTAVETGLTTVQEQDIGHAIRSAVEDVSQSLREDFHRATSSNRQTIYAEVLFACACAEKDEIGEFGSADARDALNRLTGGTYEIPAISPHLAAFSESSSDERGGLLTKRGKGRFRYRFVNPLMPPYVRMKALDTGHAARALRP